MMDSQYKKLKEENKELIKQYNDLFRNYTRLKLSTMEIIKENMRLLDELKQHRELENDGK